MIAWQVAHHRVAVGGRVTNSETGLPIYGAEVAITESPEAFKQKLQSASRLHDKRRAAMADRPDRTRTRDDGLFYFLDLPDGNYSFAASLPGSGKRFGLAQQKATVSRDDKGNTKIAFVNFSLQPTAVKGKITGPRHKSGVVLAEVRVKSSGERTFTDERGQYTVAGIEPGKRVLLVSAQGYRSESQSVTVNEPGTSQTVNLNLTPENG